MDFVFYNFTKLLGKDKAAYLGWSIASVIWVFGFLYVSQNNIDSYSSNLSRGIILLLFNFPVHLKSNYKIISPESMLCMIKRHILITTYGFVFAQCFFYLPINLVHTISSSGPVFVLIIDYFLYNIEISKKQLIGVLISSIGMLLAVNGQFIYKIFDQNYNFSSNFQNYKPESENPYFQIIVSLILIGAQFFWALSIVLVKKIKNATHYQLNFQYGLLMTMASGCLYPNTTLKQQIRLQSFLKSLFFQGLPLAIGQVFFSHSMTMTKNLGVLTMTGFISVIIGYVIKLWRYQQPLNAICLCGSILIMAGISKIVIKQ